MLGDSLCILIVSNLGDVRNARSLVVPPVDLCLSSPPYMCKDDREDPLTGYQSSGKGYDTYLTQLCEVYVAFSERLTPTGHLVIEAANLKSKGEVTTFAWDLANRLAVELRFLGETVVVWDSYGYGYEHSYCLTFERFEPGSSAAEASVGAPTV